MPRLRSLLRNRKTSANAEKRSLRGFLADIRGVTAIEFAFIAPPLFLIVLATLELGMVFLAEVVLEGAVAQVSREIRTGQVFYSPAGDEYDLAKFQERILEEGAGLLNIVQNDMYITVHKYPTFGDIKPPKPMVKDGKVDIPPVWEPGERNSIVVVKVACAWPLITTKIANIFGDTDAGEKMILATEIFKNEPF